MPLAPHPEVPLAAYRSVLDVQGLTAWAGLHEICRPKAGQTLVVTAAAGSVGSLVCQIGSEARAAGGRHRRRRRQVRAGCATDCGIAAIIDYKAEDVGARLDALCPQGIDCCSRTSADQSGHGCSSASTIAHASPSAAWWRATTAAARSARMR